MVRLGRKYNDWRALIAPPYRKDYPWDHIEYNFHEELYHLNDIDDVDFCFTKKMGILQEYPEMLAITYDPSVLSLTGSFFHHPIWYNAEGDVELRIIALSDVKSPSSVITFKPHLFFGHTVPLAVPMLKDFLACANVHSRGYNIGMRQYEWLPVNPSNKIRIPKVCYLPPAVAMFYLNNPKIEPLLLLHEYLKLIFQRMPDDNPITLNGKNIVLEENEEFPDGAHYDSDYALEFYPSLIFLWYFWKKPFLRDPPTINVSRSISLNAMDQEWGRSMHETWLCSWNLNY